MLKMETTTLSGWGRIECKRADLERNVTIFSAIVFVSSHTLSVDIARMDSDKPSGSCLLKLQPSSGVDIYQRPFTSELNLDTNSHLNSTAYRRSHQADIP